MKFLYKMVKAMTALGAVVALVTFSNRPVIAASCCGGGSSASLVLPKFAKLMLDVSVEHEVYDGFWNSRGEFTKDPAGSDLRQLRLNAGSAFRLHDNIQMFVAIPYVINLNRYTGVQSTTYGAGDVSLGFNFELFNDIRCVYRVLSLEDLLPAAYLGAKVTLPTGISPYDNVPRSFDITGLGFYTFAASLLVDKTIKSWNLSLGASYSFSAERPVNREYGRYIEPYKIQAGGKWNLTASTGYTFSLESMDSITATIGYGFIKEGYARIDGKDNPLSGFQKPNLVAGLAFATADQNDVIKLNHSFHLPVDGWGFNRPNTNTTTLEYSHVFR